MAFLIFLSTLAVTALPNQSAQAQENGTDKPKKSKKKPQSPQKASGNREKIDYLYIEASTQHLQGNRPEAISMFKEVIEMDPQNHAAYYCVGRIYAEMMDYDNARRYCEQALNMNPDNLWYYNELVNAYQQSHMPEKALSTQEALVKKFPNDKNGLYDLAQMYIGVKRFNEALDIYGRLEVLTGMNEEIAFRKHQLYMFVNQPEKALAELDRLIKAYPAETRYPHAQYDILSMMGKDTEAKAVLENLLISNPNDGFALFSLADHYKSKGDLAKSDEYLFRAFRSKDVDIHAKAKIIAGLHQMADRDPAIHPRVTLLAEMLTAAHPNSALASAIRGDVYQDENLLDSARACYRRSLGMDPANEGVWQELLFVDSDMNDDKALRKDAEKALEYFPNQVTFLYFYGLGSERTGEFDEAIYAFEKLRKVGNADKEILLQSLSSLGTVYHKTGQNTKSNEAFDQALNLSPGNPLILNNYAYYLALRHERIDDAERMAKQALDKQPNSSSVQDTYGWIMYLKGNFNEAQHWIKRAADNEGGAEVWEHLGDVYHKQGETEKAVDAWQKAIEKGAKFSINEKQK